MLGPWTGFWWVTVPCSQWAWCPSPLEWSGKPRDGESCLLILLKIDISVSNHTSPEQSLYRTGVIAYLIMMLPAFFPCKNNCRFLIRPRSWCHSGEYQESTTTATTCSRSGGRWDKSVLLACRHSSSPSWPDPILAAPRGKSPTHLPEFWGIALKVSWPLKISNLFPCLAINNR